MNNKVVFSYLSFAILIFLLSGCSGTSQESNNIQVNPANSEALIGSTEEFPLPNCGGSSELSQSLGTHASVTESVEIADRATLRASIEAGVPAEIIGIPAELKGKLEGEVERAYKKTYESAASRLDSIVLRAAPKTH